MNLILRTAFGSHLYGTNTPSSDLDFKSIYIPSAKDILLGRIKPSISQKREKGEGEKNTNEDIDEEIYSLDKFFKLVGEGQTVCLDILFSNKENHLIETPVWDYIIFNRHRLLSKNSKAFIGYCRQQAAKYGIKGSRVAAARDTLAFLNHLVGIFGMSRKLGDYASKIDVWHKGKEFIQLVDIPLPNGTLIRHLEVCGRKLPYTSSVGNAYNVIKGLVDEYGTRALLAEKNEGIDWKALSHAVRIGEQAVELFETHNVVFPRPNASELLKIKRGELAYNDVAARIEDLFEMVEEASAKSTLPEEVDKKWIDNFIIDVYGSEVKDYMTDLKMNDLKGIEDGLG